MKEQQKERVYAKLRELEKYREELYETLPEKFDVYVNNIEKKRATERILQIMIESVIDCLFLLNRLFNNGPPASENSVLDMLEGKISHIKKLKEMKGFRNILVHRYGKIRDELVFQFAHHDIDDFNLFIKDVENLLKDNSE